MKYLIMIYSNATTWEHPLHHHAAGAAALSQAERDELDRAEQELFEELTRSGEFLDGQALGAPGDGRTVRVENGLPVVTDGPFGEAKEQFAGYFIVECDSVDRATQIAARFPDARFGPVVVRPIM